jgi:hypothetical protein
MCRIVGRVNFLVRAAVDFAGVPVDARDRGKGNRPGRRREGVLRAGGPA